MLVVKDGGRYAPSKVLSAHSKALTYVRAAAFAVVGRTSVVLRKPPARWRSMNTGSMNLKTHFRTHIMKTCYASRIHLDISEIADLRSDPRVSCSSRLLRVQFVG